MDIYKSWYCMQLPAFRKFIRLVIVCNKHQICLLKYYDDVPFLSIVVILFVKLSTVFAYALVSWYRQ